MRSTTRVKFERRKAERAARRGAERGVKLAVEFLLGESQQEVPLEEATLLRSGHTDVEAKAHEVEGVISYDTPYAVIQHEALDFKHDPGRKAKYLEDPVNRNAAKVYAIMGAAMRKEF